MSYKLFLTTKVVFFLVSITPTNGVAIENFNVEYKIKKGLITVGKITREFKKEDGRFKFESTFETTGVSSIFNKKLYELSEGQIIGQQVLPSSYKRKTSEKQKNFLLEFLDSGKSVRRIDVNNGYTATKAEVIQDKLSYQAQLMLDLNIPKPRAHTKKIQYHIASQKEVEKYDIKVLGYKTIKTPLGKFKTLVLKRTVENSKKEDTVYLASDLGWLAVRIDHIDKKGRKMVALIERK